MAIMLPFASIARLGRGKRDGEPEGRAFAEHTLQADLASHLFDQLATDEQANAKPLGAIAAGSTGAIKALPHALLTLWSDTDTMIADNNTRLAVAVLQPHLDRLNVW